MRFGRRFCGAAKRDGTCVRILRRLPSISLLRRMRRVLLSPSYPKRRCLHLHAPCLATDVSGNGPWCARCAARFSFAARTATGTGFTHASLRPACALAAWRAGGCHLPCTLSTAYPTILRWHYCSGRAGRPVLAGVFFTPDVLLLHYHAASLCMKTPPPYCLPCATLPGDMLLEAGQAWHPCFLHACVCALLAAWRGCC